MKTPQTGQARTKYIEYKNSQPYIFNQDFQPFIVDNVFSKEDIDYIYETIKEVPDDKAPIQKWAGMKAWHIDLGPRIRNKINESVQKHFGTEVKLIEDHSFARYSNEYGYATNLFPHVDFKEKQTITFDIQIHADEEWGVVVEDIEYFLQDNQALVFAGSQQPHWRRKKQLKDGSRQDMIFCHLQYVPDKPYTPGQEKILDDRNRFFAEFYDMAYDRSLFY